MAGDDVDSNTLSFWLNWRVGLCALWLLIAFIVSAILIWRYEGSKKSESESRQDQQKAVGYLYEDEAWITCLKQIHPIWLLAFRSIAFLLLLALLILNVVIDGAGIFYFYTQWTFTLVTIYFGLAAAFSIYKLYMCCSKDGDHGHGPAYPSFGAEHGAYEPVTLGETADTPGMSHGFNAHEGLHLRKTAGFWGYILQILFQASAGAVVLTDIVFWVLLYPFQAPSSFTLDFLIVSFHSFNFICLLGDTILNGMRFPMFRIAYFALWTLIYVLFQWFIHAIRSMWWPYVIIDLSNQYAPLWYLLVGVMIVPCYGLFALIFKLKGYCLSKFCPESYQGWS